MKKHIVDKLVRDKVIKKMQEEGKNIKFYQLEKDEEKKQKIIEKLGEKYKTLFEWLIWSENSEEKNIENIADMIEILNTIAKLRKINLNKIAAKKKEKLEEKWWYETWSYIDYIEEE